MRIILEIIRLNGPVSRKEISGKTKLTSQTVTNITKKLIKAGLVYESDRQQTGRGAPSILLKIKPESAYSIGIDFDKDYLDCVLVNFNGNSVERIDVDLNYPTPEAAVASICDSVQELLRVSKIKKDRLLGIGIGCPGPMVTVNGSERINAINPQFYPGWGSVPIVDLLQEKLNIPVYLENNASAAAIGELWYGRGRDIHTYFYLFFGAGLGGGFILNGKLYSGENGNAGEIGYLPVTNTIPDKYASIKPAHLGMFFDIRLLFKELKEKGIYVERASDLESLFTKKEPVLMNWVESGAGQLMYAILAIEYLMDPKTIIFGGRLPQNILEEMITIVKRNAMKYQLPTFKKLPNLLYAAAGQDANALGCATLPFYNSFAPIPSLIQHSNNFGGKDASDKLKLFSPAQKKS